MKNFLDFIVTDTMHSKVASQKKIFEAQIAISASVLILIPVLSVSMSSVLYRFDRADRSNMI